MDGPINPKLSRRFGLRTKLAVAFSVPFILLAALTVIFDASEGAISVIPMHVITLALFATLAYAVSLRMLLRPLHVLRKQMSSFGRTDLVSRVDLRTGDEFEQAAASFNEAAGRVDDLVSVAQRRAMELETVLSTIAYGIYVCDARGDITYINDAGMKILGISERNELPRRVEELDRGLYPDLTAVTPREEDDSQTAAGRALRGAPKRAQQDFVSGLARALAGESFAGVELNSWNPLLGREQHIQVSGAPIRSGHLGPAGAVLVAADVTGRVEMNRRRDEMVYVTAHELRAPLTSIRGYVQLAMRQLANSPEQSDLTDYLGRVNGQIDSMVNLINRLLDVSRIETGHLSLDKQGFDIVALAAEVIEKMKATSEKHCLRLLMTEEPIKLNADPSRIEQVLINLVANAIKYSPDGGEVEVRVGKVGPTVVVSVQDEGIGIPKEKQDRIFEKLYRVETEKTKTLPGTGLGLYVSRAIIAAHGGEMHFESEEGQGATFYFMLPAA